MPLMGMTIVTYLFLNLFFFLEKDEFQFHNNHDLRSNKNYSFIAQFQNHQNEDDRMFEGGNLNQNPMSHAFNAWDLTSLKH